MGLLDSVLSNIGSQLGGGSGQEKSLLEQAVGMISNSETGGLQGLISKFQQNGLGDVVSSWVSTGENQPVSADQLSNVLGSESIQNIAGKLGLSGNQVSDALASLLPQIVDKLTPDGKVPEGNLLGTGLSALAGKFLKG